MVNAVHEVGDAIRIITESFRNEGRIDTLIEVRWFVDESRWAYFTKNPHPVPYYYGHEIESAAGPW